MVDSRSSTLTARLALLLVLSAIVATAAGPVAAYMVDAGTECPCARTGAPGRCLAFTTYADASQTSGQCRPLTGAACPRPFTCVAPSAATHRCLAKDAKRTLRCTDGATSGRCGCALVETPDVTLAPFQATAVDPRGGGGGYGRPSPSPTPAPESCGAGSSGRTCRSDGSTCHHRKCVKWVSRGGRCGFGNTKCKDSTTCSGGRCVRSGGSNNAGGSSSSSSSGSSSSSSSGSSSPPRSGEVGACGAGSDGRTCKSDGSKCYGRKCVKWVSKGGRCGYGNTKCRGKTRCLYGICRQ